MAEAPISGSGRTVIPAAPSPPPTGAPPPKSETVEVHTGSLAPSKEEEARLPEDKRAQLWTEILSVVCFLLLTLVPLARIGIIPIPPAIQIDLLALVAAGLAGAVYLHRKAGYRSKAPFERRAAIRRRDDNVLNGLSLALGVLLTLIALVEIGALLVFLKVVKSTAAPVVLIAGQFTTFAAFVLLFLDMLLIARTTFDSRHKGRSNDPLKAAILLGVAGFIAVLAILKNHGLLEFSVFQTIKPDQSGYILTLGAFLELIAFRMLLRYPNIRRVILAELEVAKKAGKEERDILERRALRAYFIGLGFVLLSFLLLGGVATGRVATGDSKTTTFILVTYVSVALAILFVVLARYLQHQFIQGRAKRAAAGEVIAKKRMSGEQMAAIVLYSFSGLFGLLFLVIGIMTFMRRTPFKLDLGTDFIILAFLISVGPYGFRRYKKAQRIHAMDDKFPDFLRDLAEGVRAGMTLPRALYSASKGVYGALTPEIQKMSAQVEWGVSFTEALSRFKDRVNTPLIQRTVSLVNEAAKAGGSVVDILTAASNDSREIKQIVEDRRRQMGIYSVIIYVAFMVFLAVIFVLANQFLPAIHQAVSGASGAQVGGLTFGDFSVAGYTRIFFHAALIQGIGSGLVAGVMTEGHPLGGLKHSFIMTIISWLFFRVLL